MSERASEKNTASERVSRRDEILSTTTKPLESISAGFEVGRGRVAVVRTQKKGTPTLMTMLLLFGDVVKSLIL